MERPKITDNEINNMIAIFVDNLKFEIDRKGNGAFVSRHEVSGVLREEYEEFGEAVHSGSNEKIVSELIDIMVASFWGAVSVHNKKTDW